MLAKKEIEQLINKQNSSLRIVKPIVTPKSSAVWNSFSCIYVNDIKQEYVICNQCEDLLIYKPSSGTNSLSKHIRSYQNVKTTVSHDQTNINQFYASSKNEPAIPDRIKQEIKVACVEFVALDCRSFKTILGIGFKNLAQKIFDAGKYLPISKDINVEKLLPHPTTQFQIAPHEKFKAVDLFKAELLKRQSSTSSGSSIINITPCSSAKSSTTSKSQQLTPTTQNILLECFDLPAEDEDPVLVPSPDQELTQYLSLNVTLEPDGDVLLFWKKHQNTFPTLASIVKTIYSIPASNTTVERLFSTAGSTISDRRTNLDSEKVNKLLFLNKNLLTLKEFDLQQSLY
ncbi:unnamed protein product, partial [Rotaria sp. Silwood2]